MRRSRQQIDGDHVHEVHQEHEREDGQCQRRNEARLGREGLFDDAVDAFDHHFDGALQLARHARRGTTRRAQEDNQEDDGEQDFEKDAVDVEDHERPVANRSSQVLEVVLDVARHASCFAFSCHAYLSSLITAMPTQKPT